MCSSLFIYSEEKNEIVLSSYIMYVSTRGKNKVNCYLESLERCCLVSKELEKMSISFKVKYLHGNK